MLPVEILQHIFSYLDTMSLFRCHDVCRLWKHCIPGISPALHAVLFVSAINDVLPTQSTGHKIEFHFSVTIHADYGNTTLDCQTATCYTVYPNTYGITRSTATLKNDLGEGKERNTSVDEDASVPASNDSNLHIFPVRLYIADRVGPLQATVKTVPNAG
jgi:hypothetical protein